MPKLIMKGVTRPMKVCGTAGICVQLNATGEADVKEEIAAYFEGINGFSVIRYKEPVGAAGTGNDGTGNEGTGSGEGAGNGEGTGNEGTGNEGTGNEGTGNDDNGDNGESLPGFVERLAAFQALPSWQKQKAAIERGEIATDVLTAIANDEGDTYSDAVRKSASKILGL